VVRKVGLALGAASLVVGLVVGGCAALLGANDPIEVDGGADAASESVVIGDASRAEIGACPLCAPPPNARATCEGGTCGFACVAGYHACDGGCASDQDERACGPTCADCVPAGATFNGSAVCAAGQCGMNCGLGWTYCGQPGECVGLAFDCHNCGRCGNYCGLFGACIDGGCVQGSQQCQ
jgi:hypothetical protein